MSDQGTGGDAADEETGGDAELAALVAEFSFRKTYRPADGMAEPDEVPQGPSGSAMGEATPPLQGLSEPEAP
ncbi:hypothetical protein [Streptomyces sp. NBC_01022]|uniref:hypothetical protein n=1 Tax=Streptomyces sp. NBC_01022 TaxID=2903723 RepID=UPI002DD7FD38|nr:hypothetical protein [Streptomyces sp. NBC_01022]WRZ83519.1 hypothetical protein OG316_26345 [Streptomyces sp. NBC_01022]